MKPLQIFHRPLWIVFFVLAISLRSFADDADKMITRSFVVAPGGNLDLEVEQSDVEIVTSDKDAVEVVVHREARNGEDSQAAKALKNHKLTFTQDSNTVHVQALTPKLTQSLWSNPQPPLNVHFQITVPRRFNIAINTTGGDISIADLRGTVDARTSGGNMMFTKIQGAVDAHTSGGNATASGCTDRLTIQTSGGVIHINDFSGASAQADDSGGNIEITNCAGRLTAKTSGGNILLENFSGPSVFADTSGGAISLSMTNQPAADCYLRTGGGEITARLPATLAVNLIAITRGGLIHSELPVTLKGKQQEGRLEGKINRGGPVFSLKTGGGDIQILGTAN